MKKQLQTLNMPWEKEYGYAQAVKAGNLVWLSGQLGHDDNGVLKESMEAQMRQTYQNIEKLLERYGMLLENIVEEVIYTLDSEAAFEARKKIGPEVFGDPVKIASTLIGVSGLALPGQLVEIKVVAME